MRPSTGLRRTAQSTGRCFRKIKECKGSTKHNGECCGPQNGCELPGDTEPVCRQGFSTYSRLGCAYACLKGAKKRLMSMTSHFNSRIRSTRKECKEDEGNARIACPLARLANGGQLPKGAKSAKDAKKARSLAARNGRQTSSLTLQSRANSPSSRTVTPTRLAIRRRDSIFKEGKGCKESASCSWDERPEIL